MTITFKATLEEVKPFLDEIAQSADDAREALGFLPKGVYLEAAFQRKLIVATTRSHEQEYVGHLLFGGVFPNAKIFQLNVVKAARRSGIAKRLIDNLVERLTKESWLSIQAKVAADLPANDAW